MTPTEEIVSLKYTIKQLADRVERDEIQIGKQNGEIERLKQIIYALELKNAELKDFQWGGP